MTRRVSKDDIDRLFEYGIYLPSRTIYLGSAYSDWDGHESGVDHMMAEKIIKALHIIDITQEPITIVMNNPGGDVYHGMAIFDAIQACKSHVTIRAIGYAMSMGSIILQAADERVLTPNARVMIHYGYCGFNDHAKTVKKWSEEFDKLNEWMEQLYLQKIKEKNPLFTLEKVKDMCNFDTILNAIETVDLGLADRIEY
jgi:ATP-dependent Clp protease protease subunit